MLSLRARLFVIISLVVLLILGVSVFLVIRSKKAATGGETTTTTGQTGNVVDSSNFNYNPIIQTPVVGGQIPQGTTVQPATTLEIEQNAVRQLAKIFVERYSSYSTDGDYQNIVEVQDLVTPELWKTLSAKIGKTAAGGSFVGVTTKVFSSEITKWESGSAVVSLNTSIQEEKNATVSDRQQKITVNMAKSNGSWLVANFEWEK